jgi:K+-sensing histidine kinase KdpD
VLAPNPSQPQFTVVRDQANRARISSLAIEEARLLPIRPQKDCHMLLADYVEANKTRLIDRWKQLVVEQLKLELEESELINDLPEVIDDLAYAARDPEDRDPEMESGRKHGRQRVRMGVDIGDLTMEMALVGEALLILIDEDDQSMSCAQMRVLCRIIGKCTEASIDAYVEMRDKQLATQAAQHFSFIAHEIRNPLQNAKLATALISGGRPEHQSRYIERLERSLAQLSDLVDHSLTEARLLGDPHAHVESLDAETLVREAYEDVSAVAEAHKLALTFELEPFEFEGDHMLVHSILTNVLKNAVKFTHDHGEITVRSRKERGWAVFEVADGCGGIADRLLNRLFEPFVQGQADSRGFGLGLAIVKQAVDAHGGSVRVDNEAGHGCTFVIELPLRQPATEGS